jgi:hypothetical protein
VALKLGEVVDDFEALSGDYDAVFLAPGVLVHSPGISGSELRGVTTAADPREMSEDALSDADR